MTDSTVHLRRQIESADDLRSVVRTMRALAASNIGEYERSVQALAEYSRSVEVGIGACLRQAPTDRHARRTAGAPAAAVGVIVFGSDQGLVGRFNEAIVDHLSTTLQAQATKPRLWVVGERAASRLLDTGLEVEAVYPVPDSVDGIAALIARIQLDIESHPSQMDTPSIQVFHHQPMVSPNYQPVHQRLLPLDARWRAERSRQRWPGVNLPEVMGNGSTALRALIREFLFISLFRACAESLASENAARLAAMERADRNIDELLTTLRAQFHRLRQQAIDEELSDLTAGYESLTRR